MAALCPASADDARILTLADCLALGRARSVAVANAVRGRAIADEDIRLIRAQVYPSLTAHGQYTRLGEETGYTGLPVDTAGNRDQYTASLEAEQLLYTGGSVRAALRAATSYRDEADLEVARREADLNRQIARAYYAVLYREEAANVARESVDQLALLEREARLKFEQQVLSEFEWLSAQVSLANEQPLLTAAENQLALARAALRNLLYLDDDAWSLDPAIDAPPVAGDLSALQALARANRWEIKQARVNLDVLEADIRVTQGEYLPEIKAFFNYAGSDPYQYDVAGDGWEWQWLAGVRATWELLDGGARGARKMEKGLRKEIAADTILDLERQVDLEVETALLQLRQAQRNLDGAQDTIRLAAKALDISRARFDKGLATNIEFTDRNLELNKARIVRMSGLFEYQAALADLRYACGTDALPLQGADDEP